MSCKYVLATALIVAAIGFGGCKKSKSSEKTIVEFWVNGVQYEIQGTQITKFFPKYSENAWENGLTPMPTAPSKVVISPGAKINPPTSEPQNFEKDGGVRYVVTAEDGSQQEYIVKAERQMFVQSGQLSVVSYQRKN